MFERVFQWCMRRGAAILFVLALLYCAFALLVLVTWGVQLGTGKASEFVRVSFGPAFFAALWNAALLLVGALIVNRFDRWLAAIRRPD